MKFLSNLAASFGAAAEDDTDSREVMFKRAAFDNSNRAMMIIDRDFVVQYTNDATTELFREHAEEFKEAFPNFDSSAIVGTCIDVFHKNPAHQRQLLSDTSRLPYTTEIGLGDLKISLRISAVRSYDGEYVGNILEWKDVTELRTGQGIVSAIRASKAFIEFTPEGQVLTANDAFLKTMGYQLDEIVGKNHSLFVDPEYARGSVYQNFWKELRAGNQRADKFQRITKDGKTVWLLASYMPVTDASGKVFKVVKFADDITETEMVLERAEAEREENARQQALVVTELARGLRGLSKGDLTVSLDNAFSSEYEQLRQDFNAASGQLRDTLNTIASGAEGMTTGVSEISQASADLSRRTESQAASIEESAAALDQATSSVRDTAASAENANELVSAASQEAESSREIVGRAVDAMGAIEKSSNEISQIISVIDEIAFQTNLLALNAGVEAARAGDAGRGFAVVASEVRALAQRSSDAAKEIKSLIMASTDHVDNGVTLVGQAGEALQSIMSRVHEVSGLVSSIAGSAKEQSRGLGEINSAVNQMDQVTQQNAAMVEQATAASMSLKQEAEQLLGMLAHFNTGNGQAAAAPQAVASAPVQDQQQRVQTFAATQTNGNAALELTEDSDWDSF